MLAGMLINNNIKSGSLSQIFLRVKGKPASTSSVRILINETQSVPLNNRFKMYVQ